MDGHTNTGLVISGFDGASAGNSDRIVLDGIKDGDVLNVSYDAHNTNKVWINLKNSNSLVIRSNDNLIYEVCF